VSRVLLQEAPLEEEVFAGVSCGRAPGHTVAVCVLCESHLGSCVVEPGPT